MSRIVAPLLSAIQRVKTASVLAPLLAFNVIIGTVALCATLLFDHKDPVLIALWCLFGICVFYTLGAYSFFAKSAPNRLQTEDYQLAHHRLNLIGDERNPNSAVLINSTLTSNAAMDQR